MSHRKTRVLRWTVALSWHIKNVIVLTHRSVMLAKSVNKREKQISFLISFSVWAIVATDFCVCNGVRLCCYVQGARAGRFECWQNMHCAQILRRTLLRHVHFDNRWAFGRVNFANRPIFSVLFFRAYAGIDFKQKLINLDGVPIKLQIWDTAGQERFRTLTTAYYRGAMGILLMYDVTSLESYNNLSYWLRNIQEVSRLESISQCADTNAINSIPECRTRCSKSISRKQMRSNANTTNGRQGSRC